jgi:putative ABC transport system permease protein
MCYALLTLWHERQRYFPAVLAVAFSALLVALQCGLLLGTFAAVSIPVDETSADVWVGSPGLLSVDVSRAIPLSWRARLNLPEVERIEEYHQNYSRWFKPDGGSEVILVVGSRLQDDAMGAVRQLTPELRRRLTQPGTVVVDEADLDRLGIRGEGDLAEIWGKQVRVVGLVHGLKGLGGPYVFCSLQTSRELLQLAADQTMFLLVRCHNREDAARVVQELGRYHDMAAFTREDLSLQSRTHWLFQTGAGISIGCAALLGLLVGAVITNQTLYAATAASLREYGVLRAMGIPRRRIAFTVLTQSFWVGVLGIAAGLPLALGLGRLANVFGARALLQPPLLAGTVVITLLMALLSGLTALRSLRLVEPAVLLR